jgi:hypothetical protein
VVDGAQQEENTMQGTELSTRREGKRTDGLLSTSDPVFSAEYQSEKRGLLLASHYYMNLNLKR